MRESILKQGSKVYMAYLRISLIEALNGLWHEYLKDCLSLFLPFALNLTRYTLWWIRDSEARNPGNCPVNLKYLV